MVKLNLSDLANSMNVGSIINKLKDNTKVVELSLTNCGLVDADLEQLALRLREDRTVETLKIGKNNFTGFKPVIELFLNQQTRGSHFKSLDFSNIPLSLNLLETFKRALDGLNSLEYLNLSETLLEAPPSNPATLSSFILKLLHLPSIKGLDLSRNRFHPDNVATLCRNIPDTLECLVLASVHALSDETAVNLIDMLRQQNGIKRLNISGSKMSSASNYQVLSAMIEVNSSIEELDISKCKLEGNYQVLGELITRCGQLRVLKI